MSAREEIARIRRLELTGVVTWLEADALEASVHEGRPTSMVHALGRLQLADLQARWLLSHPGLGTASGVVHMPSSRDQLVAAILDRVS